MNETNDYKYAGQGNSNVNEHNNTAIMFTKKENTTNKSVRRFSKQFAATFRFPFILLLPCQTRQSPTNQTIPVSGDRDELPAADGP